MWKKFLAWRRAKVRVIGKDTYIRFTPNFGFSFPLLKRGGKRRRVRYARHHGLQITMWYGARWVVTNQLIGKSTVKKESFDLQRK